MDGALLGGLQLEFQRPDPHDCGDLVGERHVHAGGHRAGGDVAIVGGADGGIGQGFFSLRQLRACMPSSDACEVETAACSGGRR